MFNAVTCFVVLGSTMRSYIRELGIFRLTGELGLEFCSLSMIVFSYVACMLGCSSQTQLDDHLKGFKHKQQVINSLKDHDRRLQRRIN